MLPCARGRPANPRGARQPPIKQAGAVRRLWVCWLRGSYVWLATGHMVMGPRPRQCQVRAPSPLRGRRVHAALWAHTAASCALCAHAPTHTRRAHRLFSLTQQRVLRGLHAMPAPALRRAMLGHADYVSHSHARYARPRAAARHVRPCRLCIALACLPRRTKQATHRTLAHAAALSSCILLCPCRRMAPNPAASR